MVPLSDLAEHPGNWRRHPPRQRRVLEDLLGSVGFAGAVIWNKRTGRLIDGHLRVEAARDSGEKALPAVVVDVDEDEERLLLASYDPLGAMAEPDGEAFRTLLDSFAGQGLDELLGELAGAMDISLLGDGSRAGEDEVPEPPAEPISKLGDLWLLGKHRLLCGDATSAEDVKRLLDGVTPDMAWFDPPYGVSAVKGGHIGGPKPFGKVEGVTAPYGGWKGGDSRNGPAKKGREHGPSKNAIILPGNYYPIIGDDSPETAIKAAGICADLAIPFIMLWGANNYANALPPSRCWVVWDKETTGNFSDVELAWTNRDAPARLFRHQWSGLMKASERGERRVHPTQKPVALARWCFHEFGKAGQTVLDLFLGSGAALIAAEETQRTCFAMELEPLYVDVAVKRWETFTGETAVKVDDVKRGSKKAKRAAAKADGAEGAAGQSGAPPAE